MSFPDHDFPDCDLQTRVTIAGLLIAILAFVDTVKVKEVENWNNEKTFINALVGEFSWNQQQIRDYHSYRFTPYSILTYDADNHRLPYLSNDVLRTAITLQTNYFNKNWFLLNSMRILNNRIYRFNLIIDEIREYKYSDVSMLINATKSVPYSGESIENLSDTKLKRWLKHLERVHANIDSFYEEWMRSSLEDITNKLELINKDLNNKIPKYLC